ncbi:MAG: S9 family peptidase [Bacteroidales bacterium]
MKNLTLLFIIAVIFSVPIAMAQTPAKQITLHDIFQSGKFNPESIRGIRSLNDGEHYAILKNDSLNVYSYKTGTLKKTLVTANQLIPNGDSLPISMSDYQLSDDEKKVLFGTDKESIFRHSSKSNYYIFDLENDKLSKLSESEKQSLASFSPDGQSVAFVQDNNLFIKTLENNIEIQITRDGLNNQIINGSTDWVYEEEFGFTKAFFWSPNGQNIAFYRFDESKVKEFQMMLWGDLYPETYKYKYPKAGEVNSEIKILVYNLSSKKTIEMDIGTESDIYIPRIKWSKNPNLLSIQRMNRLQNELIIFLGDVATGECKPIYQEQNKYYIEITDDLIFLNNNTNFILTSEQSGYNHIYLCNITDTSIFQITKGNWDVQSLVGFDEKKNIIYLTSSESSPLNRELYSIKLDGTKKEKLSNLEGNNNVQFGKQFKYYINSYSDANTPPIITINNAKGEIVRILTDNSQLKETISQYGYSNKEFFSFRTSENVELNGWMIKPGNFDPEKEYPVLMYVYGGPGSQTVRNSWGRRDSWYQMLVANGIIIVSVDNRGTGGRGEEFKKMTYMQLGKYETIDQIETAKYLASLDYIDAEKIGIWGWSYGGFMSTSCLALGSEYFNMGIAVAPVTNWRYYDNIYTERFMRTPQENPEGYGTNSPINHIEKLKGDFLLIHGTADDNVHFQNSTDLVSALVKNNKQFEMQFYPNSNHGIYTGENTTFHLYTRMTEFIYKALLK